ncbi:hypothetical protein CVT25_015638 [Psilocybe cyanescens]|uniref:Ribosomal protein S21 n=1 Tax=Psilocybe cyanescens TaxID=93625 RepID=A0A409WHW0_PSICY|nr:hypothetical protein CVT25_015638 [Psilocybe cyanescens]
MQRLLQRLPSSSLRLSQIRTTLGRPSLNAIKYPAAVTAICRNTRSITSPSHPAAGVLENVTTPKSTPEDRWKERSREAQDMKRRLNDEYAGNNSSVNSTGKNLSSAFKKLDSILARNKVRYELRLAERHEKKGVKRRRLQSQRWKNRFANEVREKVQLVNKIRKRGA